MALRIALLITACLAALGAPVLMVASRSGPSAPKPATPAPPALPAAGAPSEPTAPEVVELQPVAARAPQLSQVRSWAYQLQGLEEPGAVERLVAAPVDMLVIEPTNTLRGHVDYPTKDVVQRVRRTVGDQRPPRLCLAYLNVGQAESYRTYWKDAWRKALEGGKREALLLCEDPDGWPDNFPVAYWRPAWRRVLFGSEDAVLDRAIADGFDGVYLDWVLGFVDPTVRVAAKRDGVDAAQAMATLIHDLRRHARATRAGFLVVAQNPGHLIQVAPELADSLDGVAQEGLSYYGAATSDWGAAEAGGTQRRRSGEDSTAEIARLLMSYRKRGLPVFTVDYAVEPEDIRDAITRSRACGFVPCVTRTPLDRLPAHVIGGLGGESSAVRED